MKITYSLLVLTGVALSSGALRAQSPSPAPLSASTPAAAETHKAEKGGNRRAAMENLTPEEREKLHAARKAAMEDPAVKAAEGDRKTSGKAGRKAYREALRAAMLRHDPSVGAILDKMQAGRRQNKVF